MPRVCFVHWSNCESTFPEDIRLKEPRKTLSACRPACTCAISFPEDCRASLLQPHWPRRDRRWSLTLSRRCCCEPKVATEKISWALFIAASVTSKPTSLIHPFATRTKVDDELGCHVSWSVWRHCAGSRDRFPCDGTLQNTRWSH